MTYCVLYRTLDDDGKTPISCWKLWAGGYKTKEEAEAARKEVFEAMPWALRETAVHPEPEKD